MLKYSHDSSETMNFFYLHNEINLIENIPDYSIAAIYISEMMW